MVSNSPVCDFESHCFRAVLPYYLVYVIFQSQNGAVLSVPFETDTGALRHGHTVI